MTGARRAFLALVLVGAWLPITARAGGYGNLAPVVDAVTVSPSPIPASSTATITCSAHDRDGTVTKMKVTVSAGTLPGGTTSQYLTITAAPTVTGTISWTTPVPGTYSVTCGVQDSGGTFGGALTAFKTVSAVVTAPAGQPPVIDSFTAFANQVFAGGTVHLTAAAHDPDGGPLAYRWTASGGTVVPSGPQADWISPLTPGGYTVTVTVTDSSAMTATASLSMQAVWALSGGSMVTAAPEAFFPARIASDREGRLYVADSQQRSVAVFTAKGQLLRVIPVEGRPMGVAVGTDGTFYLGDIEHGRVDVYDRYGDRQGSLDIPAGEQMTAAALGVDPSSGRVFVADTTASAVHVYDADRKRLSTIPLSGGQPVGLAVDAAGGRLYVADNRQARVSVFTLDGAPLGTIGTFGAGAGQVTRASGVLFGPDGFLYVVDPYQSRVGVFTAAGAFVSFVGTAGREAGQLLTPTDVAADAAGHLVVGNADNGRLEVYTLVGSTAPSCTGDTDCDGIADAVELTHRLDPNDPADAYGDPDGDGLANIDEIRLGTDMRNADTDGDGVSDRQEVRAGLDPLDPGDNIPSAEAGGDFETDPTRVVLDGSGSDDPNGDPLTFAWQQIGGQPVVLEGAGTATPSFVERRAGDYLFALRVSDGRVWSAQATVRVRIRDVAPTADAGPDRLARPGDTVVLDGRFSSDANGDSVSLTWTQAAGPPASLALADTARPSFVATAAGLYTFELGAADAAHGGVTDRVDVVVNGNSSFVPAAIVAASIDGAVGSPVVLDGSASVVGGATPSYAWRQTSGPAATLEGAAAAVARFVPAAGGVYTFELTVGDGTITGVPAPVVVVASAPGRHPPLADPGPDQRVRALDLVVLDGAASLDLDGDPVTCTWRQTEGVHVALTASGSEARFVPLESGTYVFELVAADADGAGTRARTTVVVDEPPANSVPVAVASVRADGRGIWLEAEASYDADQGTVLNQTWSAVAGPPVVLMVPRSGPPTMVARFAGVYVLELRVDDNLDRSPPARVVLSTPGNTGGTGAGGADGTGGAGGGDGAGAPPPPDGGTAAEADAGAAGAADGRAPDAGDDAGAPDSGDDAGAGGRADTEGGEG